MDLLPIIYLSLLITVVTILVVVTASFIASKLRNSGNDDRILALAYEGSEYQQRNSQEQKVIVHTKVRSQKRIEKDSASTDSLEEVYVKSNPARTTRTNIDREMSSGRTRETSTRTHYRETRYSQPVQNTRVEIWNPRPVNIPTAPVNAGGEVRKSDFHTSSPLYFYSAENEQKYYTVKAY